MKLINADMCLQTMNDFHVFDCDKEKMFQQGSRYFFQTQNVLQIGDNIDVCSTNIPIFSSIFWIIDVMNSFRV